MMRLFSELSKITSTGKLKQNWIRNGVDGAQKRLSESGFSRARLLSLRVGREL
jgi:hypothetical protein